MVAVGWMAGVRAQAVIGNKSSIWRISNNCVTRHGHGIIHWRESAGRRGDSGGEERDVAYNSK